VAVGQQAAKTVKLFPSERCSMKRPSLGRHIGFMLWTEVATLARAR
jgi:hypothetical protein